MKSRTPWLAYREIIAVHPDGTEQTISLKVGTPFEVSPGEWACECAMDGYQDHLHPIHGVDAWQAIQLVFALQHQLLSYLEEKGAHFQYLGSREPLALSELFPKPPTSSQGAPRGDA